MLLGISVAAHAQNESEALCGTWIDDTAQTGGYKWVFAPDGTAFRYKRESDEPYYEGRYSIEKKWKDENGNTLYQCYTQWSLYPYKESKVIEKYFILFLIDVLGETVRSVWSQRNYPEDLHSGLVMPIHQRQ